MLIALAAMLGACSSKTGHVKAQSRDVCLLITPICIDPKLDAFSDPTARQVLSNNEVGAKLCGWTCPNTLKAE